MDTVTINNLEWQYEDDGILRAWKEAVEYAKSLGKEWRLPTIQELQSLIDYTKINPACVEQIKCRSSFYWSGTTVANYPNDAWNVDFYNGNDNWDFKENRNYVRCVRSIGEKND